MVMITSKESLEEKLTLRPDEKQWFENPSSLPLLISDYYFSLIGDTPDDPIRREVVPQCSRMSRMPR